MSAIRGAWLLPLLAGCQEFSLHEPPPVEPAEPPGSQQGDFGDPPNWQDCFGGFHANYSNLTVDHPDVEPDPEAAPPDDPKALDWWARSSYERYDGSLDFGGNWWPVDEGLAGDPAYFAVRWRAWIRAWSSGDVEFLVGASDDVWVLVNGEPVVARPGIGPYEPETYTVRLNSGQYPIEVLYAHRSGPSGFRFRVVDGDVSICYPNF